MAALPSTLRSHRLRRIIGAYTVNRLGTWFGFVALSVAVFDHTHSAVAVAALLISGQALPAFVAPALAARVEASQRRGVLSGLYLFEGVVTTLLAVLLWHFWLPAILILAALDGTAALAASALLRAETARAAREQAELEWDAARGKDPAAFTQAAERQANATLNIAFSATFMLGPAIAGVLVAAAGAPAALFIDAASFLICGGMLLDLSAHAEDAAGTTVLERLRAAWAYVNEVPLLRALLLAEAVALVFFDSAGPIEVAYAKNDPARRRSRLWPAAWSLGSRRCDRKLRLRALAQARDGDHANRRHAGNGACLYRILLAGTLQVACLAAVLGGVGNGVEWASVISIVQRLTPPALHGRLMSAVESIGALALALGLSLGGALVALTSARDAFLVVGIGATAMTALIPMARSAAGSIAQHNRADDPRPTRREQRDDPAPQPHEATVTSWPASYRQPLTVHSRTRAP